MFVYGWDCESTVWTRWCFKGQPQRLTIVPPLEDEDEELAAEAEGIDCPTCGRELASVWTDGTVTIAAKASVTFQAPPFTPSAALVEATCHRWRCALRRGLHAAALGLPKVW